MSWSAKWTAKLVLGCMLDDKVWMLKVLVVVEYKLLEFNCSEIVSYAINVVWFAEDIDGLSEDKLDWDCEKN
jgi:hypothetical protein